MKQCFIYFSCLPITEFIIWYALCLYYDIYYDHDYIDIRNTYAM